MAALKRKRGHSTVKSDTDARKSVPTPIPVPASPPVPRRATRSVAPLPVQQELEPRRRRRRGNTNKIMAMAASAAEPGRGKENIPLEEETQQALKPTRSTRHSGHSTTAVPLPALGVDRNKRPAPASAFTPVPVPIVPPLPERAMGPPGKPPAATANRPVGRPPAKTPILPPHQHTVGRTQPITIATSVAQARNPSPGPEAHHHNERAGSGPKKKHQESDRNIDKVVLGDICFRAWYPSYYGKEVLGDGSGGPSQAVNGGKDGKNGRLTNGVGAEDKEETNGAAAHGRRDRENPPILERLYVCPCCFKYSTELVAWFKHVEICEKRAFVPGNKIYVHPKGQRTVLVSSGSTPKQTKGKRASIGPKVVEEVVQDKGEWSVWEVDGAKDVLFCQNLSLFAKLFLDNKSVFFDVTGFNYFLLVYTPPTPRPSSSSAEDGTSSPHRPHRSQIVGFFSKEKMSWDNNNLACILIFPPWQRKGLGALLMGVSYEISRREGIMGGPEKPISDLGKKGYKRFWAGEIARWLLSLDVNMDGEDGLVVDVNDCSQATWIAPEDCLLVLREMGVAEEAGKGPPLVKKAVVENEAASPVEVEEVQRVKISQESVRAWVKTNNISLERTCDPAGFIGPYAKESIVESVEH
ncbi:males-absent on the first protein [Echria macrotheca]|uniref:histone acetyltransferase n=1 Tax=Echria macrotheca TaxID=438768 RepID=A0AAJ0BBY7_9PEZI|nr:males-absent on the first protein [Echria macrotheca]